jgi:hypothetical protein
LELQERAAENLMLHGLYWRRLHFTRQDFGTKFSTAGFNWEPWGPAVIQSPRNSCNVNLPHSDTELVIAIVKLQMNC